jgi:NAD(P)-dependent dehydrogenase (short-subunit alcohol dehydrogenase family)
LAGSAARTFDAAMHWPSEIAGRAMDTYHRWMEVTIPAYARIAEELGYERVWVYDSPALYGDIWLALGRTAEATESIGLGSGVAVPSLRHVMDIPPATAGTLYGGSKAALHRFSQGVAAETYGQGISVNVLSPLAAIGTPNLRAAGWIPEEMFEPVETMVESVIALLTGDPMTLTGMDVFSIQMLNDLQRPVYDFSGTKLIEGWQPEDLPRYLEARATTQPLSFEGQARHR